MKTKGLFYTVMGAFLLGFVSFTSFEGTTASDIVAVSPGAAGAEFWGEECEEEEDNIEHREESTSLIDMADR